MPKPLIGTKARGIGKNVKRAGILAGWGLRDVPETTEVLEKAAG
jgi:hypothetical protein